MLHQRFYRFFETPDELNPAQIENAQTKIRGLRRRTGAISGIEAPADLLDECPFSGNEQRQKYGCTRTKDQPYRCRGCQKTSTGRIGLAIGRIHRPDLFMVALREMPGTFRPPSVRELARQPGLDKWAVWRWRKLTFSIIRDAPTAYFSGVVDADETHQRESRKGSREWVRHFVDPFDVAKPPRPRWKHYTRLGLKMMRGLSKRQLHFLSVLAEAVRACFKGCRTERARHWNAR